eukprot:CAMPEP_0185598800 /NCGR_PEP_ID=MMETSP0434-20130131/82249_1 /TAXON_ID=626734 ORGANISM="Favella taraikaensis, Strain Fe Narragansett Bay" /NCGR_SAMPLE_ID=MMETSP0434 /ASSEMBLY_ACC=CAM_ASM_000379 /LENGTH=95 /DNA_ID=CAMNT_0028227927 /DNA_START=538 /DNA_END=826 /DNA_ORIENTATION=-
MEDSTLVLSDSFSEHVSGGIDGLVLSQLEKKQSQLGVVLSFLNDFDMMTAREEEFLKDLDIKLAIAMEVMKFHEQLKHEFQATGALRAPQTAKRG